MRPDISIATVLVGSVADGFAACERSDRSVAIDVEAAREQRVRYAAAIGDRVPATLSAPPSARHPDCVFVEDTVVILDAARAVATRPGAPSRRGEVDAVVACLPAGMAIHRIESPATVDGGDVLRVDEVLFIGLSTRTNRAGAAALGRLAAAAGLEAVPIPVPSGLHLKSACSLADPDTLVYTPGAGLELGPFRDRGLICVASPEPAGANVLALGAGRVLVSAAAPNTAAMLRDRGLDTAVIDASELHKADGALTCCSIRIPAAGGWCT